MRVPVRWLLFPGHVGVERFVNSLNIIEISQQDPKHYSIVLKRFNRGPHGSRRGRQFAHARGENPAHVRELARPQRVLANPLGRRSGCPLRGAASMWGELCQSNVVEIDSVEYSGRTWSRQQHASSILLSAFYSLKSLCYTFLLCEFIYGFDRLRSIGMYLLNFILKTPSAQSVIQLVYIFRCS